MTKLFTRTVIAALAATAMGAAVAGTEVVEVTAGPLRGVFPAEADNVVGAYRMSDGRGMLLTRRGNSISASLDGEPLARLLSAGNGQLRATDGHMSMRFDIDAIQGETHVTLTLLRAEGEALKLAALAPQTRLMPR
jgi:hypothetical protein